jgi:phage tail protein X
MADSFPSFPVPGGLPTPVQPPVLVLPRGYPSRPVGGRVYISTQGDWWDLIAIKVYGRTRGNEHLMYRLLEENYPLREVVQFPAGLIVNVPVVAVTTEIALVPWKSATVVPAP